MQMSFDSHAVNGDHAVDRIPDGVRPVRIGRASDLVPLPHPVDVAGVPYYLTETPAGLQLVSRICPHKGGIVADAASCFECPRHGWRFERATGRCLTGPTQGLSTYPVLERD